MSTHHDFHISRQMRLNKIVKLLPESVKVLQKHNIKAIGCCNIPVDPLEQVLKKEGIEDGQIDQIVSELEALKSDQDHQKFLRPTEDDYLIQEVKEGNKNYYRLAGMLFSESAFSNIINLADKPALRIKLEAGGCSGFKYQYDYVDKSEDGEYEFRMADNFSLRINEFTFHKLHGSIVDFKLGLHDSGLKIINPNIKGSCSCGTSVNI